MQEKKRTDRTGIRYNDDLYYENINPEDFIIAGKRLGIMATKNDPDLPDWWVAMSPRNHNFGAEGPWEDFVELANMILERDKLLKQIKNK